MDKKKTTDSKLKKYGLFALSLLLAFFVWIVHNMSLDYSVVLQYRVNLQTDLVGHSSSAVSDETLLIRGKGRGFYIAQQRREDKPVVDVPFDGKLLVHERGDVYRAAVSDIREKLSESIGSAFEIEYISNDSLTFTLPSRYYKRVPVVAESVITFPSQYMQVGDITFTPDSVDVYGVKSAVDAVDDVRSETIRLSNLTKSVRGDVKLKVPSGVTLSSQEAFYDVRIERYVEMNEDVEVTVRNLPDGKSMVLLPSRVNIKYRTKFGSRPTDGNKFVISVDYNDFASSDSKKMIPRYVSSACEVYSYDITPQVVEGILTDAVRRK
jgi:hypothetical protein